METTSRNGLFFNRRYFLQGGIALGVGALGLDLLATCGSTTTTTTSSVVTASVNTLPPNTNPGAQYVFNQVIKQFEQGHFYDYCDMERLPLALARTD
jgi:multiple sugar transport system substrate-binding protein